MIAENQIFRGKRIYLDGCSFHGCTFERCILVYSGTLGVDLVEARFIDCRWEVEGAALRTLRFLKLLYAVGARRLVENIFSEIRGERSSSKPPVH